MPVYNGEKFIAEAISSILSQTYSALSAISPSISSASGIDL
ncbi:MULTISPECIES: hypothetical protein [Planktothrix]|nr:hypothetical protein [Planktothrix agardhii]